MITFAKQKGITIVAMPNIKKCSLVYEVQKYKKNRPRSEKRWGKRYCALYKSDNMRFMPLA